jgi:hypothetical protein
VLRLARIAERQKSGLFQRRPLAAEGSALST